MYPFSIPTDEHVSSGVAKGGGAVRLWRHFYGGGTMGFGAVGYKPAKAVLK